MQKQLKALDQQLNANNLTRVLISSTKPEKSLFRAISLSIYFSEDHIDEVIRILRLSLLSSCKPNGSSFPSPHRKARFLAKFAHNQTIIDEYFLNPDASCFSFDSLQLASLAFVKRVILFTLSKDGYLQENIITACTDKVSDPPIMVAKVLNRYFCVQSQPIRSVMMFVKQNIINQLLNLEAQRKESEQIEQFFPEYTNNSRPHKKSLSDSGDNIYYSMNLDERNREIYGFPENTHSLHAQRYSSNYDSFQLECYDEYFNGNQYMLNEYKLQRQIIPNQRYTGRLKFFDQNGNYGFIVVDGFGSDLFVHFDDLQKTGVVKERLLNIKYSEQMRFEFTCLQYDGKQKKSKKAVDLKPIPNEL